MKKVVLIFLILLFSYAKEITIQLKWKYQFQFAGFIMAKEKGFYKKEGLDVILKEFNPNQNIVKYVLTHKHSYGVGDSDLIYNISKGDDIELLMPIYQTSPFVLAVINKKVNSLKDIEKLHIPISKFALKNPSVLAMLKTQNIDEKKLYITTQSTVYNDLHKVGAFIFYKSNEIYTLHQNNIIYKLFDPQDYGINMYGDILFTSKKNYLDNPKEVHDIIKATKEGFTYAFNHIDETIHVILNKYNNSEMTYKKLKFEAQTLKPLLSNFSFNEFRLENIKNIFIVLGIIERKNFNINDYIYHSYQLSKKDKKFIKTHLIQCITTDTWEPFNLRENGELTGIAVDYWKIIKNSLNLNTKCQVVSDWNKVLSVIKHKKADITLSTMVTKDRLKYAVFTKPYARYPIVIATRNNIGFINDIGNIKKVIAVGKDYTAEKLLKEHYPNLNIIEVKNTNEALKLVSEGKVFAAVDILPVIAYKINKYQYSNLKISGKTPFEFAVRFMIRKDYKELVPMINKVIDNITSEQKKEIYQKWVSVIYQEGWTFTDIKYFILFGLIVLLLFIIIILFLKQKISQKQQTEEKLEKLAMIDSLTGIFNRYKLDKSLEMEIELAKRYKRPFSLIFCDIDFFKKINDTFGHKVGDKVLQELSKLIYKHLRKSDIFGRWGGEEFMIIAPETGLEDAVQLAKKLRKLIEDYDFGNSLKVTCSFGVVEFSGDENIDEITKRVDSFLYKAKNNGRNRVEY